MKATNLLRVLFICTLAACQPAKKEPVTQRKPVQIITLDPGHFHAALVQKTMYPDVDSTVYVYAPPGPDVSMHLDRIAAYNARPENPTHWNEIVYTGNDFLEKMSREKKGTVVVIAGNNQKKAEYIRQSLQAGLHVLADKPMAVDADDFSALKQSFASAEKNNLLLYDIMTERYEITTILQRELSMMPEVFGTLEKGTADDPAVTKESVHHFYKYVSGKVLTRPAWFMDVRQQGEGIVDVTTHLVDLVQWECFPEQSIDTADIDIVNARRWTTPMTRSQFRAITALDDFPDYLKKDVTDSVLNIFCNGETGYTIKGVHAKVSVTWAYQAPGGGGDTHYSIMRGTKANLVIRQGAEQKFKPALYIEPRTKNNDFKKALTQQLQNLQTRYAGIELKDTPKGWEIVIPDGFLEGHEAHFARVMEKFLGYLKNRDLPAWEIPNMIAKYYTTTHALERAKKKQ